MTMPQFIPTVETTAPSLIASVFLEELYFDELVKKFPQQEEMVSRIAKFLSEASNDKMFDSQELYNIIQPPSLFVLSEVLAYLVGNDILKRIVRVSIDNIGTFDYDSVTEVPNGMLDPITKKMVTVLREHVHVWFQKQSKEATK
jgi:hypothetical protein